MLTRAALACAALSSLSFMMGSGALADELSDKLCPLLEQIASTAAGKADYAVQAELVMQVGGAYEFDGEKLRDVTDNIDASATENCPDARTTILSALKMTTLQAGLR